MAADDVGFSLDGDMDQISYYKRLITVLPGSFDSDVM